MGHDTQVVAVVAAVIDEYLPEPQFLHVSLPLVSLYLPPVQAVQYPGVPVNPLLQRHCVLDMHVTQFAPPLVTHVLQYAVPTEFL